jgi:hypothetical protein
MSGPPDCPTPTATGYWWQLGADRLPPADGPWIWVDLTNAPPAWEIEVSRLESQAQYDEWWVTTLSWWHWRWKREAKRTNAARRLHIERIRAAKAVVP